MTLVVLTLWDLLLARRAGNLRYPVFSVRGVALAFDPRCSGGMVHGATFFQWLIPRCRCGAVSGVPTANSLWLIPGYAGEGRFWPGCRFGGDVCRGIGSFGSSV